MRSDRPYRRGWPDEQVLDYIQKEAGLLFDPHIAEVFMELDAAHLLLTER